MQWERLAVPRPVLLHHGLVPFMDTIHQLVTVVPGPKCQVLDRLMSRVLRGLAGQMVMRHGSRQEKDGA